MKRAMFTRPFKSLDCGDLVVLLDSTDTFMDGGTYLWEVSGVEPVPSMPHGAICLLTAAAAPPAGYTLDQQGKASINVPAGGQNSSTIKPQVCQLDQYQLGCWRFRTSYAGLPAGLAAGDLSYRAFSGSLPRWTSEFVTGEGNATNQVPDPADFAIAPAQGADKATPLAYPSEDAWDAAWATELWSYYNKLQPGFQLVNNGAVDFNAAGATAAWLMEIMGVIYTLTPYPIGGVTHQVVIAGEQLNFPTDVGRGDVAAVQLTMRPARSSVS